MAAPEKHSEQPETRVDRPAVLPLTARGAVLGAVVAAAVITATAVSAGAFSSALVLLAIAAATGAGLVAGAVCGTVAGVLARAFPSWPLLASGATGVMAGVCWWVSTALVDWTGDAGREATAAILVILVAEITWQHTRRVPGASALADG